jgi:hypothetical protein
MQARPTTDHTGAGTTSMSGTSGTTDPRTTATTSAITTGRQVSCLAPPLTARCNLALSLPGMAAPCTFWCEREGLTRLSACRSVRAGAVRAVRAAAPRARQVPGRWRALPATRRALQACLLATASSALAPHTPHACSLLWLLRRYGPPRHYRPHGEYDGAGPPPPRRCAPAPAQCRCGGARLLTWLDTVACNLHAARLSLPRPSSWEGAATWHARCCARE